MSHKKRSRMPKVRHRPVARGIRSTSRFPVPARAVRSGTVFFGRGPTLLTMAVHSIRGKLTAMIMITSATALLVAGFLFQLEETGDERGHGKSHAPSTPAGSRFQFTIPLQVPAVAAGDRDSSSAGSGEGEQRAA